MAIEVTLDLWSPLFASRVCSDPIEPIPLVVFAEPHAFPTTEFPRGAGKGQAGLMRTPITMKSSKDGALRWDRLQKVFDGNPFFDQHDRDAVTNRIHYGPIGPEQPAIKFFFHDTSPFIE